MREKRQSCAGAASYTHAHCQKMHFTKISSRLHNTIVFCFVVCPSQLCCKRPKCTVARKTVAMFIALGTHRLLVLACCVTASAHTVAVLLADKTIQQFGLARIVAAATDAYLPCMFLHLRVCTCHCDSQDHFGNHLLRHMNRSGQACPCIHTSRSHWVDHNNP